MTNERPIAGEDESRAWRLALVVVLASVAVRLVLAGLAGACRTS